MIDFLSNPGWINPQIDFLLFLQNIRIGNFDAFDKFFLSITVFGEFWLPTLICAIVYWCFDFRVGLYLFSLEGINSALTHFFKMIACVYRPWVLSDKIHPSELALSYAKGYSFPSGHSSMSSSVLGGLAYVLRKKKLIAIILIFLILLIGFSRLWLGVHTPQDVICGLLIGLCLVFVVDKIINWAEEKNNRYLLLALIINILIAFIIIYICYFNNYRMDYVRGELLVNPEESLYCTIGIYGYLLGMLNGCCLCRRFFPFNPKDFPVKQRITVGVIGGILIIFWIGKMVNNMFLIGQFPLILTFLYLFTSGLFVTLIYPIIFQKFINNKNFK